MAQELSIVSGPDTASSSDELKIVSGPDTTPAPKKETARDRLDAFRARRAAKNAPGTEPVLQGLMGVGEGAIETVQALASPIRKAFGMKPAEPPPTRSLPERTTALKVGKGLEQAGEFIAPEAAAGKIVEGTQLAAQLPRAAKIGAKAVLTGLGTAGLAKAQGDTHPIASGLVGAAGPVAEGVAPTAFKWLRRGAREALTKALGVSETSPTGFANAVKGAVPDALDAGLKPTWTSWLKQWSGKKEAAGQALEKALAGPMGDTVVPTKPVLEALEELKNASAQHKMIPSQTVKGLKPGQKVGQLVSKTVVYNERLLNAIEDVQTVIKEHGDHIQARQLVDLKRAWDDFVYKAKDFANRKDLLVSFEARAKDAAANAARSVLDKEVPSMAELDKAYSTSRRLFDAIRKAAIGEEIGAAERKVATKAGSTGGARVGRAVLSGVGLGAADYSQRHSIPEAVTVGALGGLTTRALESAFQSPAWRTMPAATKNALAKAIINGQAKTVREILSPLLSRAAAGEKKETAPAPKKEEKKTTRADLEQQLGKTPKVGMAAAPLVGAAALMGKGKLKDIVSNRRWNELAKKLGGRTAEEMSEGLESGATVTANSASRAAFDAAVKEVGATAEEAANARWLLFLEE